MFFLTSLFRLIVLVASDLALFPSLAIMQRNKRHFELFVGIFQLTSKTLYNLCQALQISIFLNEGFEG
jgi:hypothetical protein